MIAKALEGGIVACATSISFTCDGKHIISVAQKYIIHLWNIETGEMESKLLEGHDSQDDSLIRLAAISPSGMYIALQADNPEALLQFWNVETGKVALNMFRPLD